MPKRRPLLTPDGRLAVKVSHPMLVPMKEASPLERQFAVGLKGYGRDLPPAVREHQFILAEPPETRMLYLTPKTLKPRAWTLDFAWPAFADDGTPAGGVAVLLDHGQRQPDPLKVSAATQLNWTVIRLTAHMLEQSADCVERVRVALICAGLMSSAPSSNSPRVPEPSRPVVKLSQPSLIQGHQRSELEEGYLWGLRNIGSDLPRYEEQFRFAPGRRYRADFAWPEFKVAVELQGACFMIRYTKDGRPFPVGRHNADSDRDKMNLYAALGWRVLQFSTSMLKQRLSECIAMTRQALLANGWDGKTL